jgi:viroplasmin and RNaseH domain-containing protein
MSDRTEDPIVANGSTHTSTTTVTSSTRPSTNATVSPLAQALADLYHLVIIASIEHKVLRFDSNPETRWSMINEETDICMGEVEAKAQTKEPEAEDEVKLWKETIRYHLVSVLRRYGHAGEDITNMAHEEALECAKDLGLFNVMLGKDAQDGRAHTDASCA